MEQKILVEFVRKNGYQKLNKETGKWNKDRKKAQRVGVVVAIDRNHIGWAKCHNGMDEYTNERGMKIAIGRAVKYKIENILFEKTEDGWYNAYNEGTTSGKLIGLVGQQMYNAIMTMKERAEKYFKNIIINGLKFAEMKFIRTSDGLMTEEQAFHDQLEAGHA